MKSAKSILSIFLNRKKWNLIVIVFFLLAGCNGPQNDNKPPAAGDSTTQAGKDTTQPNAGQAASLAATLNGPLYVLRLSKHQYHILSKGNGEHHKIVFKFYFADSIPNSPTLVAFASKRNNQFIDTIPIQRLTLLHPLHSTLNLDTLKDKFFGDQEVLVDSIDSFLKRLQIPSTSNYHLRFTPNRENIPYGPPGPHQDTLKNVVYYDISVDSISTSTPTTLRTNPSPPRSIQ